MGSLTLVHFNADIDAKKAIDVSVSEMGTLTLLTFWTPAATAWRDEWLNDLESWQCHGLTASIEARYIGPILQAMLADGLVLEESV